MAGGLLERNNRVVKREVLAQMVSLVCRMEEWRLGGKLKFQVNILRIHSVGDRGICYRMYQVYLQDSAKVIVHRVSRLIRVL